MLLPLCVHQAGQFSRWRVLEGARRSLWTLAGCVNEEDDIDGAGFLTTAGYTPGRLMFPTKKDGTQQQGVWKPLLPRLARRFVFRLAAGIAPPLAPPLVWKPGDLADANHPAFQPLSPSSPHGGAMSTHSRSGKRARLLALVLRCGWGLDKASLAEALVALRQQNSDPHSSARARSSPSLALLPLLELRRLVVAELRRLAAAEACPVCLERPAEGGGSSKGAGAAWQCVHAVCSPCLASMEQHGLTGSCPICRAPNTGVR
jgi:hypothetical protein